MAQKWTLKELCNTQGGIARSWDADRSSAYKPLIYFRKFHRADVAQLVEQPIRNRQVTSSSLVVGSSIFRHLPSFFIARSPHCDVDCDVSCAGRWPSAQDQELDAGSASKFSRPCGP